MALTSLRPLLEFGDVERALDLELLFREREGNRFDDAIVIFWVKEKKTLEKYLERCCWACAAHQQKGGRVASTQPRKPRSEPARLAADRDE